MASLRKYGVETKIVFPLITYGSSSLLTSGFSAASGDFKIIKDEAASANTTNNVVDEGNGMYSITISATEMQAARIIIAVADQTSPKVWEDTVLIIDTYGNASAQHAFDLDTATQDVNVASMDDDTITSGVFQTDSITNDAFASSAINSTTVAANTISSVKIADSAIGSSELAASAVSEIAAAIAALTLDANVVQISGDSIAADNMEADYDGTGYNKSNSTIGTTTTNTDMRGTNSSFLAANAPTNFSSLTIGADGIVDANIEEVRGTDVTDIDDFKADVSGIPSASSVADAVWDEATSGHTTSGTFGEQVKTDIDAILADTADLQANQGDWATATGFATAANLSTLQTTADNIETDTQDIQSTLGGLNDLSAAEVNSQVDTALADYDGPTKAELDTAIGTVTTAIGNLNDPSVAEIVAGILAAVVDGTVTLELALKTILAVLAGEATVSGSTVIFKDRDGSTTRATIVTDSNQNRTSSTITDE